MASKAKIAENASPHFRILAGLRPAEASDVTFSTLIGGREPSSGPVREMADPRDGRS
jgi:hypothetical protein